ncbi:VWA domain-containing protein [Actibacterium sp. 188UL27-1]|nr:VWA domain-containing protein [Actibacterium sp. 188UL27-1]
MLVFDGSASMSEVTVRMEDDTRIVEARKALRRALPDITPFRDVGLLVYGPGGADSCSGIDLRLPPAPDAADAIVAEVDALVPGGLTPLAASVAQAAEALDYHREPAIVVLITDGNETCGGRPCALGAQLAAESYHLKVHVIGFRVFNDPFSWNSPEAKTYGGGATVAKCLADQTGGMFVSTETVDDLVRALRQTLGCLVIGSIKENSAFSPDRKP